MTRVYYLSFEIIMLFVLILCIRHAARGGAPRIWQLAAGIAYGVVLELVSIRQLHAYEYGQFSVMVLDVPLVIGVGWGTFIYGARRLSDSTGMPGWSRPILDALLVLCVDIAMDPIAVRLGMWQWNLGARFQHFGVPYGNYWAWFWVVFSFSAAMRSLTRGPGRLGRWAGPPLAVVAGVLVLLLTNTIMAVWIPLPFRTATVATLLLGALGLVLMLRPKLLELPDPLAGQVSLITQVYFLILGFVSGDFVDRPRLLIIALFVLALSIYVFTRKPASPQTSEPSRGLG